MHCSISTFSHWTFKDEIRYKIIRYNIVYPIGRCRDCPAKSTSLMHPMPSATLARVWAARRTWTQSSRLLIWTQRPPSGLDSAALMVCLVNNKSWQPCLLKSYNYLVISEFGELTKLFILKMACQLKLPIGEIIHKYAYVLIYFLQLG